MQRIVWLCVFGLAAWVICSRAWDLGAEDAKPAASDSMGTQTDPVKRDELAGKASKILARYCLRCHSGPGSKAAFDVRTAKSLLENGVISEGDAEGSLLWELVHRGTMPPRGQLQLPRPSPEDAQVLADWIKAGASPFPPPARRQFVSLDQTLQGIHDDLKKIKDPKVRMRQRYSSLAHLHNQSEQVSEETLLLARAALSKVLNSLSWQREIVLPRAVDPAQTLFAIDMEKLGWTREHWRAVRAAYPYAIGYANLPDDKENLQELHADIVKMAQNDEPQYLVRADWFITMASQPPLYHALLYEFSLPELRKRMADGPCPDNPKHMTAGDLERFLDVDVIGDIQGGEDRSMRAAFGSSGVSEQNRLIERHRTRYGAYWKSYDFKAGNRRSILSQFPLGPVFPGNKFADLAFEHDGGEIIFHLPNGLQGYLLVDGKDNRINAGPIEVVSDALKTSGSPAIVNGLSCMSCHKHGIVDPPEDEIRKFARVLGNEKTQVQRLYPLEADFDSKWKDDRKQFLAALEAACGKTLRQGDDSKRDLQEFPEPVSEVSRIYLFDELDLAAAAAELYEPNPDRLRNRLETDEVLKQLGLGVLLNGKIKRAFWEARQGGVSVMQLAAFALDYTTPRYSN